MQSKEGGFPKSTTIEGAFPNVIGSIDGAFSNPISGIDGTFSNPIFWKDGGFPKLTIKFGGGQKLMQGILGQILMHGKTEGITT